MNYTFNLKKPSADSETLIFLRSRFKDEGKYLKYSTGESIHPKQWDKSIGAPKNIAGRSRESLKLREVRSQLDRYAIEFERAVSELNLHGLPVTVESVREKLDLKFKKNASSKSLYDVYDKFIEERIQLGKVSSSAIKKDRRLKKLLRTFEKETGYHISFARMNKEFYVRFAKYCREERDVKLKNNTLGKYFGFLKTFLRWALENKYHLNNEFLKWEKISSDTYEIAISATEFQNMLDLDYSGNKRLEKVRDIFVFGCATGMRYSDYSKIDRSKVESDHIVINTQKSRNYLTIPLNRYSRSVLLKYDYNLPLISPQKFRKYVKEVARDAGMTKEVTKVSFIGSKRIEERFKKYQLVSTHTARRTFITLSLEKGMRPEVVMSITGHKDYKSFQRYIKLSQRNKAEEMTKAWN